MPISGQTLDDVAAAGFGQHASPPDEVADYSLVGDSAATQRLRKKIDRIGPHFRTLLVRGEIGTGKELTARAFHARSGGARASFVHCHGASLAESIDSEGVFAATSPWHLLQMYRSGTFFLDSVDEIPMPAQSRLLEVFDSQMRSRPDLKMIAATCQNLERMVAEGRFRPDLYHRLAAIEIVIEPLRKRREDIPPLVRQIVRRFSALYSKGEPALRDDSLRLLVRHHWPGNVRELKNVIHNGVLMCDEDLLEPQHLNIANSMPSFDNAVPGSTPADIPRLQDVIDRHVVNVLQACSGNKVRAAEMLGISRSTLYRMLESSTVEDIPAA